MTSTLKSEVLLKITSINNEIEQLTTLLPYADGPQYYIDKQRIHHLKRELSDCLRNLENFEEKP